MSNVPRAVPSAFSQSHRAALESVRAELGARFLERTELVDGLLSALLCKQHVALIGPPGTAKSQLVDAVVGAIEGATSFSWLLTKFTTPEEVFGPVSLAALQQDRFRRVTSGKLPEAHVAFLDECFKGSSAILNSLLGIVNERRYHNDGHAADCPLLSLIGASNELPETAELEALFDRFLVRFEVKYLVDQRNVRTLVSRDPPPASASMTLGALEQCQDEVDDVELPDEMVEAVLAIKQMSEEAGFRASDRRWRQSTTLLKARAYLDGDARVSEDHLEVLADVLWRRPQDRPAIAGIIGRVGNPLGVRALEILDAAREALGSVGTADASDASAKADWLRRASLVGSRLQDMERELEDLSKRNPKKNTRRVRESEVAVRDMRLDLTKRVADLYRL